MDSNTKQKIQGILLIIVYIITRQREPEWIDTSSWNKQTRTLKNTQLVTNKQFADPRIQSLQDLLHFIYI